MAWKDLKSELAELFGELSSREHEVSESLEQRVARARLVKREGDRARYVPRHTRRLQTKKRREEVERMLRAGMTGRDIAKVLGVHEQTISIHRNKLGLGRDQKPRAQRTPNRPQGHRLDPWRAAELKARASKADCSVAQLAKEFGVEKSTVKYYRRTARRALAAAAQRTASSARPDQRAA